MKITWTRVALTALAIVAFVAAEYFSIGELHGLGGLLVGLLGRQVGAPK